jgi:hypothetical protein
MRPPGPALRRTDYTVETIPLGMAREIIAAWHYARGAANTAVYRHGLFHTENPLDCLGAALWMPPTRVAAEAVDPDWQRVLTLSRLVIEPGMPTNAASFLLGRSIELIRRDGRYRTLVTYADEAQGHTGAIYRATNWVYTGARTGDPVWVDQHGRQVARKAGPRSRTAAQMRALGYRDAGRSRKHRYVMHLSA